MCFPKIRDCSIKSVIDPFKIFPVINKKKIC